jgi:predicted nucleic acid-binding protein
VLAQARRQRFQIPGPRLQILDTARLVQQQYADLDLALDLDLADAVNVALAARNRTGAVLTLDRRDFRAVRPLTPHKWFRLLRRSAGRPAGVIMLSPR